MRTKCVVLLGLLVSLSLLSAGPIQQPAGTAILFEGARLINGEGGAPIENSAFVVENNRFTRVGRKGEVPAPSNAMRVDLTGKTVMPGIIDVHSHLGYTEVKTNRTEKETYTRENLFDHLRRLAYYGVVATLSMGVDRGEIPFQVRAQPVPDGALFFTAGGGIALPGMGPGAEYRKDAAYGVTTEAEARKVVQQLAAKKVDIVKFWVDDRNGTVKKLPPDLYRAIIDETHKNNLRAVAHIFYLEDAKELMRAGVDGFAHGVRDKDIDDEFMALLKSRRVFFTPNLPERPPAAAELPFIAETVPIEHIEQMRDDVSRAAATQAAIDLFNVQARNLKRISDVHVATIGFGTDSGVSIGWTTHMELADMVAAGMSPSEVITAATKTSAEIMKLTDLGTIAPGKSADFVVLDANPLENIRNTRKISRVYVGGRELNREALKMRWTSTQTSVKGGEDVTGEYIPVAGWPAPFARSGYIQGVQTGIFAESPDRIFIMNRGEVKLPEKLPARFNGSWGSLLQQASTPPLEPRNFILVYDGNGKLIESWTQHDHLFAETKGSRGPHKVKISPYDPERHIWIVDDGGHQILKFTNDGKSMVMRLGTPGEPGNDERHFNRPTDIAWLPDGTFFISDGYVNTRVVKFDKDGKFIKTWGSKGNGPGQFNLVHSIDIDKNRRVYVADRDNSRIQIFDEDGKLLDQWPNIMQPYHVMITADQDVWVVDGTTNRFFKYDLNGKLLYAWGVYGYFPGGLWGPHQFSVDADGNVYVAEAWSGRSQKFTPKPGADRAKLIGPPVPLLSKVR